MLAYLDTLIGFAVLMLGISLMITILNQIVSAFLAYRGSNMRWGLEVLFKNLDPLATGCPLLAAQARTMAETVLSHPLISDSIFSTEWARPALKNPRVLSFIKRWQLATAIRPEELSAVLTQIVAIRPPGIPKNLHAALRRELGVVLNAPSSAAIRDAALSTAVATAVIPPSSVGKVIGEATSSIGNLEEMFGKIIDRVRQRFTTWMRIWTVGFAFAIAGIGCVDSIAIIKAVYTNGSLRAQLVSEAPQTTASAQRLMPNVTQLFTKALSQAAKDSNGAPEPSNIDSKFDAVDWIDKHIPESSRDQIQKNFETNFRADLKNRAEAASQIVSTLYSSGLPEFSPRSWQTPLRNPWQLLGVFITALLLSLGAPFWFNTLSSLTSLRPLLAGPSSSPQQPKST